MRFERVSIEDGLSQSFVTSLVQDATGFLWLGTQSGLNRYDGYRFEIYRHDPSDPASVAHDWISVLAEDPSGDLWVGTEGGGLSRWRRATDSFQHYRHDPDDASSLSGHRVIDLAWAGAPEARKRQHRAPEARKRPYRAPEEGGRRASGALWIATFDAGLNRLDPASGSIERFRHDPSDAASLSDDQLAAVYVDRGGTLWVGTWGGLDSFEPETGTFRHHRHDPEDPLSLSDDRVRVVVEDARGRLWIGTRHGLNRLAADGESFERFLHEPSKPSSLSHDSVRCLFEDSDGRLWVGTDGGLNLWREEAAGFAAYLADADDPESLSSDAIAQIAEDRSGVLWIGTLGGGVGKWNPSTWSFPHYRAAGGASNNVFAISEDPDGGLWIGTVGSGLERIDRDTGRRERHGAGPGGLGDDRVTALLHDREGTLWIGTVGAGVSRFDRRSGMFESHRHDPQRPGSLSNDAVTVLYEDRRDRLWVGTWIGGLNRYLGDGTFRRYRHDHEEPRSLGSDRVFSLAEDSAGRLWVATDGAGLNLWREEREDFLRLVHDPDDPTGLSDSQLAALHADAADRLWIGTKSGGLDRLVSFEESSGRAVFENYSAADGLAAGSVWGILSDESGHLWLSTNGGLSRLDPESRTFRNFDTSHGLQSNEFNQGAYYRSASGEMFFGGVDGFNAFFPDRIRTNTAVPPVVLTGLTRFNDPLTFGRPLFDVTEVGLSYKDHFLAFEFAALDFTAPEKNHYRYRLEGFDEGWVDLGTERRVTFASLEPGDYTLRVQGANNDGVWNEEGLALALSVAPPFWQRWWFRSLTMLFSASVFVAAYRVRTRAIRNRNILLERQVKERTRDLEDAQEQLVRKEKLATLGELAGSLAHEIRNPLGVIKNAAYLLDLMRQPDDEDTKEQLDQINQEIDYSSNIVGELLDFAREPAAGRRRLVLQDAVTDALEAVEVPPGIELERRLEDEPLPVRGDPSQIRSILANLLGNAVQAMDGRGTLRAECGRVKSDRPPVPGRAEAFVSVIDTGSGISAENLEKIFEPLFTTKARGIGLGLSLSLRYAKLNEGRIECDSEEGKGSIFRLVLPLLNDKSSPSG